MMTPLEEDWRQLALTLRKRVDEEIERHWHFFALGILVGLALAIVVEIWLRRGTF